MTEHFKVNAERVHERQEEEMRLLWIIAVRPNTPGHVLDDISKRVPAALLVRIAEHPRALVSMLERLAQHPSPCVRAAVAENLNTPLSTVYALSHDLHPDVRYSIAENHQAPLASLTLLSEDENPYIACRAHTTLSRLGVEAAEQGYFDGTSDAKVQQCGA
jgi:hypothetical protein